MRTIFLRILFGAIVSNLLFGCVSLQSVSLTQIPEKRSDVVVAKADKLIFLGLSFDNDFVDTVSESLKGQCKGGQIKGILTKDELTNYFLFLVVRRSVSAHGYCVKG